MLRSMIRALDQKYIDQPYLVTMYHALLVTKYYGMFRIGEVTDSTHVLKACDVHIGVNKPKMLFILHTSKTNGKNNKLQLIKITANKFIQDSLCLYQML